MTASAIPVLPDAATTARPGADEAHNSTQDDFDEEMTRASEAEDPVEAPDTDVQDPKAGSPEDQRKPDPVKDPTDAPSFPPGVLRLPIEPPPEPVVAPQNAEGQVEASQVAGQTSAQPVLDDRGGQEVFELEELPPAPVDAKPLETAQTGSDSGDESDAGNKTLLSEAAQALDVETAELDGLIEPDAVAEGDVEVQDTPELPVKELDRLRVTIDDDLAVVVGKRGGRIDVAMDGSAQALREVEDLGPELAASLKELGFELGGFSQKERKNSGGETAEGRAGSAGDANAAEPRKARGGRLVNRLA